MKVIQKMIRYNREGNPVRRIINLYSTVFVIITLSNYSFMRYRIPLYEYFAFLPDIGVFLLYLWIILLLDEIFYLFEKSGALTAIIGKVKFTSLAFVAVYAAAALLLAVNGIGMLSVKTNSAKIVAVSNPYSGSWNNGSVRVEEWEGAGGRRKILLTSREREKVFVGQEVEVVLRKGILFLNQVLEVRQDWEKYYDHMLKAAPDSIVASRGLVYVYMDKERFDEAQKWYARYAEKGDHDGVGTQLAQRMIDNRLYGRAVILLKDLIKEERSYENLYTLGYALAWAGKKQEAAIYLQEATEFDPADYRAFYSLGYVYRDTHNYAKAKQAWENVLELIPQFPEVEKNLQDIERKL